MAGAIPAPVFSRRRVGIRLHAYPEFIG